MKENRGNRYVRREIQIRQEKKDRKKQSTGEEEKERKLKNEKSPFISNYMFYIHTR